MTSVPQLPVEAASAKVPPKGETPRAQVNKPSDEGAEGGFAAVLAQALPASAQAAKAAPVVVPTSSEVAGEGTPAEDAVVADAAETEQPANVVKAAAPLAGLEAPLQQLPAAAAPEKASQLVAMTETRQDRPAADIAGEDAVVAGLPEAPRQLAPKESSEESSAAPTKTQQAKRTAERPQTAPPTPQPVEPTTAAVIPTAAPPVMHVDAAQSVQAPPSKSTAPEKQEAPPVPRAEGAAEPKRLVETPAAANTAPRPANEAPVIEFQVRRESPLQDPSPTPQKSDWVQAIASKAAESQQTAGAGQLEQAAPTAETAVRVVPGAVDKAIEPAATKQVMPTPSSGAATQTADTTPEAELGQPDAQARRDHSNGEPDTRDEQVESPTTSVKSAPANLAAEPEATEAPKPGLLKPLAAAQPAASSSATAPQVTAQSNVPAESSATRPPEETAPMASAKPPSAPEIAAKLQQQSGRTTLNVVLQDERLGRVALQLVERGGWIETAIRASDPRTAQTLSNGAAGLFEALQQRGLALSTGGGDSAAWDAQEGQRRDNPQRDQESRSRRFRLRRNAGEFEGALARAEV